MTKNILVVQNIQCEHLGTFSTLFQSDGYNLAYLDARKDSFNQNIQDYSGIVILGGPISVYNNYDYLKKEQNLIHEAVTMNIPILGICLGSQLIAQALGGQVYPGKIKEIGWYDDVEITEKGAADIFHGITSKKLQVFHWHGDTFSLPDDAIILAKSDRYIQAFKIKTAIGIQFHIEVNKTMIEEWLKTYSSEISRLNISQNTILNATESQIVSLNQICKILYKNFSKMIDEKRLV